MNKFFLQIWNKKNIGINNSRSFNEIVGHTDIKMILKNAIISKKPVHILLVGPPGSAKTMFLVEINRLLKESLFTVGSNTSKAGLINQLFDVRPRFVLMDELEKMNRNDQTSLLHLMETGIISESKIGKTRQMSLSCWVFATANSCKNIIEPLLSRFVVLEIGEYSFEEFKQIAICILKNEKLEEPRAINIAEQVWHELGSRDVRDVVKVARLSRDSDVLSIVGILKSHFKKT